MGAQPAGLLGALLQLVNEIVRCKPASSDVYWIPAYAAETAFL
jgi:hypothetical protein